MHVQYEGVFVQMKPNFPHLVATILLILFLAACNMPQGVTIQDSGTVSTSVALTLQALTALAPQDGITTPISPEPGNQIITQVPVEPLTPTDTPSPTLTPSETTGPTNTPNSSPGSIAGSISGYPYGSIPRLLIMAFGKEPPYNYSYLITAAGETYYSMSTPYLIPGHFQVVAYDASGHTGGCTFNVLVISNETVNCDITNWGGGYPSKPSGVPFP